MSKSVHTVIWVTVRTPFLFAFFQSQIFKILYNSVHTVMRGKWVKILQYLWYVCGQEIWVFLICCVVHCVGFGKSGVLVVTFEWCIFYAAEISI